LVLSNAAFGCALAEIVWINLLLSGDNAVVIALASRSLPPHLQRWGLILGTVPAVLLRIAFSGAVAYLMTVPFLKIIGGVLLAWIAYGLLHPTECTEAQHGLRSCTVWTAAWTIIVADAVMSLDNVVAIAAAARGNMTLLVIGLLISMPMVIGGAGLLMRLLQRFPIMVVASASLLGFIAGELAVTDPWLTRWAGGPDSLMQVLVPIAVAAGLAAAGLMSRQARPAAAYVTHSQRDAA
jgi:YjbE family integral membrane protein